MNIRDVDVCLVAGLHTVRDAGGGGQGADGREGSLNVAALPETVRF